MDRLTTRACFTRRTGMPLSSRTSPTTQYPFVMCGGQAVNAIGSRAGVEASWFNGRRMDGEKMKGGILNFSRPVDRGRQRAQGTFRTIECDQNSMHAKISDVNGRHAAFRSILRRRARRKWGRTNCPMVDSQLRVRGVRNLRVADASIMPAVTTGNTQAPCVMIGERMAEMLGH